MTGKDGVPRVIYPAGGEAQQVVDYLEPYLNIRSTLFLPLNDAPWISGGEAAGGERSGLPRRPLWQRVRASST